MSRIYHKFSELVGHTPLYQPQRYAAGLPALLLVKLECFNPAGSSKDRIAVSMLDDAEKSGMLREGFVIVEPTSGNTGIGLAAAARSRGYRVVLTMPDTMSMERRKLLAAYGAEVVLTPGSEGMQGAINEALRICASTPGSFMPSQFANAANPKAHFEHTGPEIWSDTDGEVDYFVAGVGTGGTITGTGAYLKSVNPSVKIIAVEPAESPVLTRGVSGAHGIQGIGANFVPEVLDRELLDEVMPIKTAEAYEQAKKFAEAEGILVGISSGAALAGALKIASNPENAGKTVVALLPDSGERYLSTTLYDK